jgi:hypothetical protein
LELVASFQFTSPMADEEAVTADLLGSTDLASIPELWGGSHDTTAAHSGQPAMGCCGLCLMTHHDGDLGHRQVVLHRVCCRTVKSSEEAKSNV